MSGDVDALLGEQGEVALSTAVYTVEEMAKETADVIDAAKSKQTAH